MPHRETVAGEAAERSATSNSMRMRGGSLMRSPDARQSARVSSSTVLRFSIHKASTGPSKLTQ